jgi:hypothetical protein
MNINEAYPSNFLKATDLQGKEPTVIISHVKKEEVGDGEKPVIYFSGKEKGIVLNKTNATNIADIYGPETDAWSGKAVTLFTTWVDFNGRSVEAIRIRRPSPNGSHAAPANPAPQAAPTAPAPAPSQESENPAPTGDDFPF